MSQPTIQVIPTGVSAVKDGNHWFRVIMQSHKDAIKHQREIDKTLPAPRERK